MQIEDEGVDGTVPVLDVSMNREGEDMADIYTERGHTWPTTYSGLYIIQNVKISVSVCRCLTESDMKWSSLMRRRGT